MLHSLVYIRSSFVIMGVTKQLYITCGVLVSPIHHCLVVLKRRYLMLYECYICTCLHHCRCFSQKILSVPSSMHCPIQPGCRWVVCKEFHYNMSQLMWTPINYRDVMNVSRSYTHYILYVGWKVLARKFFW